MTKIDFTNFHDQTLATFSECATPDRPADFKSEASASRYWDVGHGVIRQSDHWVGRHCYSQRSCRWSLDRETKWGEVATGYCAYEDFEIRKPIPVYHTIKKFDLRAAEDLRKPMSASDWSPGRSTRQLPRWAEKTNVDRIKEYSKNYPLAVRRFVKNNSKTRTVVWASPRTVNAILRGAKKIKIGEQLSGG